MKMKLACQQCWDKKQAESGDIFDVITEHILNTETMIATCKVCGCKQDVEIY